MLTRIHGITVATIITVACIIGTASAVAPPLTGTLTIEGSPYIFAEDVTVPIGEVLLIDAGVEVLLDSAVQFRIEGRVLAQGTDLARIQFGPNGPSPWGGILVTAGDSSMFDYVEIFGARASHVEGLVHGGGIRITAPGTHVELHNSSVRENSATGAGGGIAVTSGADALIQDCVVQDNSAEYDGAANGGGGGIWIAFGGTAELIGTEITGNWTTSRGGGVRLFSDEPEGTSVWISDCVIAENTAGGHGGGISDQTSYAEILNTLIVGNTSENGVGGGIHTFYPLDLRVVNCTITENTGATFGAVYTFAGSVSSSIIWNNNPPGPSIGAGIGIEYTLWSTIGGPLPGPGNVDGDPLFKDPDAGDYSLVPGSPGIDAADPYGPLDLDASRGDMGWNGARGAEQLLPRQKAPQHLVVLDGAPKLLSVENVGSDDLTVESVTTVGSFQISTELPDVVAPGGSIDITVTYLGGMSVSSGTATITTNDPYNPVVDVDLLGAFGTPTEGVVSGVWTIEGSPYRISGPVSIAAETDLTIEAGVEVLFDVQEPFIVEGQLYANGSPGSEVIFDVGGAGEWYGLRFGGGAYAELDFAVVTGVNTVNDGRPGYDEHGAIYAHDEFTEVNITNSKIIGNHADSYGGGIVVLFGATVYVANTLIDGNSAFSSGGAIDITDSEATFDHCTIVGNNSYAAPMGIYGTANVMFDNCTIVWNHSDVDGAIRVYGQSNTTLRSSIVRVNSAPAQIEPDIGFEGSLEVRYSNIHHGWPGIGNIDAFAHFVDAGNGDYSPSPESPVINAGDPLSAPDPDGTQADIGAGYFHAPVPPMLALPHIQALNGRHILVDVIATALDVSNIDLAFTFDPGILLALSDPEVVARHIWEDVPNSQVLAHVSGDTVFVSMISEQPMTVTNHPVASLQFQVNSEPVGSISPLTLIPEFTNVNESAIPLADGSVETSIGMYGDISNDGEISAFDASLILQYVVHLVYDIDELLADVSDNGSVSGYDAALVLHKILQPGMLFPVEENEVSPPPPARLATDAVRTLTWQRDGDAWLLRVGDAAGILSVDLSIGVVGKAGVSAESGLIVSHQVGDRVDVSLARPLSSDSESVLLRLTGADLSGPPELFEVSINEGAIPAVAAKPAEFTLRQNAPNPFNPTTTIRFTVAQSAPVKLSVYSMNGQLVREILSEEMVAGAHEVVWDGRDAVGREVSSGVYVYLLRSGIQTAVKRMTLVR
jgi:hypothetical protein